MKESELTYDWSKHPGNVTDFPKNSNAHVNIQDESSRDGLQGTSATKPTVYEQKNFLEFLTVLGVEYANIGFPSSSERQKREASELVRYRIQKGLRLSLTCATRALQKDIEPIVDISAANGDFPLEAGIFLGSSRLRSLTNNWDRRELISLTKDSVTFAKKRGLPVMFILEDSTRAHPEDLTELYRVALDCGADRICIADTVGIANERTTRNIIRFIREEIAAKYPNIKTDWHGHNDRGLAVANCIVAAEEGIDRIHATTLCSGERAGNVDLAQLLLNLNLEGFRADDLTRLPDFGKYSAKIFRMTIPANAPVIGSDAHSTSSGVHADAILKALAQGNHELASRVYSAYDPAIVGRKIDVRVGPMSGESNAIFVLGENLGLKPTRERIEAVLKAAKDGNNKILEPEEVRTIALGLPYKSTGGGEQPSQSPDNNTDKLPQNFSVEGISLADYTVISAGLQFGVFEEIASGNSISQKLQETVPTEILPSVLAALSAFGYINKVGNKFELTPITRKFLLRNSPENIIPLFENSEWYLLAIEGSKSIKKGEEINLSEETIKGIVDISERISADVLTELGSDFPQLFTDELEVLDLGCGKMGVFAEIGRQNKKLKVTCIEKNPYAIEHLERIKGEVFGNRLQIVESDVLDLEDLGKRFDFIYLSHLLHWIKPDQIENVIKYCKNHLTEDGTLVIHEDYLQGDGLEPKASVRKNLTLSLLGYRILTKAELEALLEKQEFSNIASKVINDRRLLVYAKT